MPVIVRDLDDDAATIIMVDSNLQRESLLPSERAFAYRMKLEAIKHQGERSDLGKLKKSSMNEVNRALAVSVGLSKFYLCQKECAEHLNQIAENNTRQ